MAGSRDGTGANSAPWASLFDPIANARALADVQAQGLRAAGELVERLVRSVDGAEAPTPPSGNGESAEDGARGAINASRLLDAWVEVLQRSADSFGRAFGGSSPQPERLEVHLDGSSPTRVLRLEIGSDGAVRSGTPEAWLHNGTRAPIGPLTIHGVALQSPDAGALRATLTFEPSHLDALPARSSRGVAVAVVRDVDLGAEPLCPGTYRSLVQVTGAPEVWLPVEVVVVPHAAS